METTTYLGFKKGCYDSKDLFVHCVLAASKNWLLGEELRGFAYTQSHLLPT